MKYRLKTAGIGFLIGFALSVFASMITFTLYLFAYLWGIEKYTDESLAGVGMVLSWLCSYTTIGGFFYKEIVKFFKWLQTI